MNNLSDFEKMMLIFIVMSVSGSVANTSHIFIMMPEINFATITASLASGFPVNVSQGLCTALMMFVFGKPLLEKLDRIKLKYGMLT